MLKPKRKIARQELKKDPLLEKIAQTEHLLKKKGKTLSYVALGAVAVIVVAFLFIKSQKEGEMEASGGLGIAQTYLNSAETDAQKEMAIEKFNEVIAAYPGTKSAGYAVFSEAKMLLDKEEYTEAEVKFNTYINDYADVDLLTSAAYSGLAVCKESAGEYSEAAKLFEKSSKETSYTLQKQNAMLNSVRNYILCNELGQAELLLKKVSDEAEDAGIKNQTEILSAQLEVLKG